MCVAQRCPVCDGSGSVLASIPYGMGTTAPLYQTCHGCGGCGWVVVHCINEPIVQFTTYGEPVEPALPGISNAGYPVAHD